MTTLHSSISLIAYHSAFIPVLSFLSIPTQCKIKVISKYYYRYQSSSMKYCFSPDINMCFTKCYFSIFSPDNVLEFVLNWLVKQM